MFKHYSKIKMLILSGLIVMLTACSILNETNTSDDLHLQPSEIFASFDKNSHSDFSDYIEQTSQNIKANKIFMDVHNKEVELAAATPFELNPAEGCRKPTQHGILLIHGLADMPFAMRDLAHAFSENCFLVRTILLPGHGIRAADLLNVNRQDWLNAVEFGVETLKQDVNQVYVGGFSLGGLLSVLIAAQDPDIKGTFAFSPALALGSNWQIRQSLWLRHLIDWIDKDKQDDYARYEAMPINAIAETYLLTEELQQLLDEQPLTTPVFLAQSSDDPIIDTVTNQTYFSESFTHPASKLISYTRNPSSPQDLEDQRIRYINSFLPQQRITGFSHQAVHVSPANTHYGVNGDYRNCGINTDRSAKDVDLCLSAKEPWRGELFDNSSNLIGKDDAFMRLTFNPYFDQLIEQALVFVNESESSDSDNHNTLSIN